MKPTIWSWMLQPIAAAPTVGQLDRAAVLAAVQLQLEAIATGERIDVVAHLVEIGERHVGPHGHDQHERRELDVLLGHAIGPVELDGALGRLAVRIDRDDGVRNGFAVGAAHRNREVRGLGGSRQHCNHEEYRAIFMVFA
jgi:hypothetical protein